MTSRNCCRLQCSRCPPWSRICTITLQTCNTTHTSRAAAKNEPARTRDGPGGGVVRARRRGENIQVHLAEKTTQRWHVAAKEKQRWEGEECSLAGGDLLAGATARLPLLRARRRVLGRRRYTVAGAVDGCRGGTGLHASFLNAWVCFGGGWNFQLEDCPCRCPFLPLRAFRTPHQQLVIASMGCTAVCYYRPGGVHVKHYNQR